MPSHSLVRRVVTGAALSASALMLLASVFGLVSMSGCTTTATYWDENAIRRQTLRYYNNEIMENLIRASQGLLFVHVDLNSLQATVTTNYSGTVTGGQTLVNSSTNALTNGTTIAGKVVTGLLHLLELPLQPQRDLLHSQ